MSSIKKNGALADTVFDGFGGIDATSPFSDAAEAGDIENFRVLADGSLEKRCGFVPLAALSGEIRAVWSGNVGETFRIFSLAAEHVFSVDPDTGAASLLGDIGTSSGKASFFYFKGFLYLADGSSIYVVGDTSVSEACAYAPLIGKDWASAVVGEEYEPLNLATKHVRISYIVNDPPLIYLCTKYDVESIDAVYINGELITDTDRYYYHTSFQAVCVLNMSANDRVVLYLTLADYAFDSSDFLSCTNFTVYGGMNNSRLFAWGGNEKNSLFFSSDPPDADAANCRAQYGNCGKLYFPITNRFGVGDGRYRIMGLCRHYDRLLIFTDGDTWMTNSADSAFLEYPAVTVNSSHGCNSENGAVMCGNDPVSVGNGTILRWSAQTDELDECNAYSISKKADPLIPAEFFSRATVYYDAPRNELLLSDENDSDGTVWIYGLGKSAWYRFTGIGARFFFSAGKQVGFARGSALYVFSPSATHDVLADGTLSAINARYTSAALDFSQKRKKRLRSISLTADFGGGTVEVSFRESGNTVCRVKANGDTGTPQLFRARLNSRRFGYLNLELCSNGEERVRIYGVRIGAKE